MQWKLQIVCGATLGLGALLAFAAAAPQSAPPSATAGGAIVCRVLEAHTSEPEGVALVIFHQGEKSEGLRLGELLRAHDGARVEFETSDGRAHPATLFRLSTCFGRGLLVFPAGSAQLAKREQFWLKFPQET
jgi:hypothetical protein